MLPWWEAKSYLRLISDDKRHEMRFQASLAGLELEESPGATPGNSAWQQAMRMKQDIIRR